MKKLWGTFALLLVLVSTLFSYELNAAGTSTTSNCTGAGGQSQLGQYCNSSQSSQQGSDANSALWKVWGGVSVVCLSACHTGGAGTAACTASSAGGSATQGIVTKNYASGLMSVGQGQATSYASSKMSGNKNSSSSNNTNSDPNSDGSNDGSSPSQTTDPTQDQQKAKKAKMSACMGAITAAGQAMSNYRSMQSATQAAMTTTKAAASLDSSATETSGGKVTAASLASSKGGVEGSGKDGMAAATAGTMANICATARQTSGTVETLQCAIASDPTLPSMVTSGQLPAAFTKASGTDFSNFGSNPNQSPADAIAQAASGSLSTADGLKVAAVLKGMEGDLMAGDGTMYSSGGGGTGSAGKSDESVNAAAQAELQEQMKDMMAKMQGDQAEAKVDTGVSAVIYANQNRAPASIPQDKSLNIFDRVTYRYYFVMKQLRVENSQ